MGNVRRLQEGLKKLWTGERYSAHFQASPSPYKDFQHALLHIVKASGRLLEMVEEADHGADTMDPDAVKKYVADLAICSVRLANVSPAGGLDLEKAVFERIERKMGAGIEPEADAEEERLKSQVQRLRAKLSDLVYQWDDPSDRNYKVCGLCGMHEYQKHKASCLLAE